MILNKYGLQYFMYLTTLDSFNNNKNKYYLPVEIRKQIWYHCYLLKIIQCYICNKILVNFNLNIYQNLNKTVENYSIINGNAKCNKCFID